ncbi:protein UNUSUAL FLORAL ORGANS [Dorcoceras hygrometricum]|uniref:Protein UNUSUAL FLORAL ORGANS n=1 Tax=Dorcoceras hygrometricum TaxID=472368 RepID=A0A2Z7ADS2_9LAMI|nr:protein UNUSUAL FLORAL ORGANS [Dorcoceras hygrometricum]
MEALTITPNNNTSCTTTTNPTTSPWMDSRIWSRLPQSLIDRIISCLAPPAFFRARTVCKRWYALIFANSFLDLHHQVSPPRHWFLFFKQQNPHKNYMSYRYINNPTNSTVHRYYEGYLFDPLELKWYRLSFPLIPHGYYPATSSGGLICWVSEEAGSKSILLGNPLLIQIGSTYNSGLIQLPSTLRPRLCPCIGLAITDSCIDLVFAGDDMISLYAVKNLSSESFHIDGGGFYSIWGTTASLPRLCSLESAGRMVHVEGRFYCMNYSPFSVLSYEIMGMNKQWCEIQAPMRRFLRSPSLVESGGKLLLVAAVEKSKLNVPKSLRMWGLQTGTGVWVEIERMPQQLYVEFAEIEGGRGFDCIAHGDFVAIIIKKGRGASSSDHRRKKALLYEFGRKRWLWMPPCPAIHHGVNDNDDDHELLGFAYQPKVAVPIAALLHQLTPPFLQS